VNVEFGFVVVGLGHREGVQAGYRFDIVRETFEGPDSQPRMVKLGEAVFEKYMGGERSMSKLKVVEGDVNQMRREDEAVAHRRLTPVPAPEAAKAPAAGRQGVYKITGQAGGGLVLDYGAAEGAKQTDVVYVYKDGEFRTKLRLDKVEREFSVGNVIEGTMLLPPQEGDQVFIQEVKKSLVGRVVLNDDKRGMIAVDLRQNDGVRAGQRFEVRRQGKKVGTLTLTGVHEWGSWAKPEGETRFEDLQKGDFIEAIEPK
jgi:hypothetical protein